VSHTWCVARAPRSNRGHARLVWASRPLFVAACFIACCVVLYIGVLLLDCDAYSIVCYGDVSSRRACGAKLRSSFIDRVCSAQVDCNYGLHYSQRWATNQSL
jgi:hypothetical protein